MSSTIDEFLSLFAYEKIECPVCKQKRIIETYSETTTLYCPPVYDENGVQVNRNKNRTTTYYRCAKCGNEFSKVF